MRKCLSQRHKSIHLALEVKTFFDNSTLTTGSSTESRIQSLNFPLMTANGIIGREERGNLHIIVIKQSLRDYAQQDWPVQTKWSDF
jgi:hypothetical protein